MKVSGELHGPTTLPPAIYWTGGCVGPRAKWLATCYHTGILLGLFELENGGDVTPKRRLNLNGLHGVISHMRVLFITTAVRTSNPTFYISFIHGKKSLPVA
jgi:hypothetical protein